MIAMNFVKAEILTADIARVLGSYESKKNRQELQTTKCSL
jgi:hypothetical protein